MKNKHGFTLIELVVSITIFSFVMLYGLAFFTYGNKNKAKAREMVYALQIAQDKIEELRTYQYLNLPSSPVDESIVNSNSGKTFARNTTLTPDPLGFNAREVAITVTWRSDTGKQESLSLRTIISGPTR
jgi:prepilin-type N-terminal cleavage/methylation domain-containing protein